jgi:enoyl-CoA hydratase/carnithine racemase
MEGSTLVLTFNRPEVRNAINWTMERELFEALHVADRVDEVKAVILTGSGEMFSAGHDLREQMSGDLPMVEGEMWSRQTTMLPSWDFRKPFIAAVHNFVGPFANGILLTADFIIAATGTRFSFEHSRISIGKPWGPYPLLFWHFPPRVIYKLWFLGGWMDAEQAHHFQYVQRVVDRSQLEAEALHWAAQASLIDPDGFADTKKGVHEMMETMGLLEMVEAGKGPMRQRSGAAQQRSQEFNELWSQRGIKEALRQRDAGVDPLFTQV